jgi:hypothetical protein
VWQSLAEELKDHPFTVLAVALDHADAARPWITAAKASYPCLIDREHHVAELYNLVNVPQAVWIDEQGRIVRPPENAGMTDGFRAMDRSTFAMPEAANAERVRMKALYMDAVLDWSRRGATSVNALGPAQSRAKLQMPSAQIAEAHARFRLGQHLLRQGQADEGLAQMAEASDLHPDSWAMWRQAAPKDARGLASGPAFWARVDALGSKPYYPSPDLVAPQP